GELQDVRPDLTDKVIDHKDGNPENNEVSNLKIVDSAEMPEEEFVSLMDAIHAHDTLAGLEDLFRDVITPAKLSVQQRVTLQAMYEQAKESLAKDAKKPAKKK